MTEMPPQVIRFERRGRKAIWQLRPGVLDSAGQPPYGERAMISTVEWAEGMRGKCEAQDVTIAACKVFHEDHGIYLCPDLTAALAEERADLERRGWHLGDACCWGVLISGGSAYPEYIAEGGGVPWEELQAWLAEGEIDD